MKKLFRSKTDRILGGVCGGIGEYFDIDPVLVRIGWTALNLMGPGLLCYLFAFLFVPEETKKK